MRSILSLAALMAALTVTSVGEGRPKSATKPSSETEKKDERSKAKGGDDEQAASGDESEAKAASDADGEREAEAGEAAEQDEGASADEAEPGMHSSVMVGVGVSFAIVGTAAVVVGTSWMFARRDAHAAFSYSPLYPALVTGAGGALLIAGIPLWIVGAGDATEEAAAEEATIRVTPLLGPTSAGLHVQF